MFHPENREDVQKIILSARAEGRCLVPRSSDGPHIHGASENPGCEIVDFSRMDKILKVSRHDRYIRLQPGVSFAKAIPAAAAEGLRLNLPFLPRAGKSVVASALEREAPIIPKYQFDYPDPLLTLEAVFGSGDVFRTGSAAGPGPAEELKADMVAPWGPGSIDYLRLFSGAQGTMGLVTWATLKAEVLPAAQELYFVESDNVASLCNLAARLLKFRVPDECLILNSVNLAAAFSDSLEEEAALLPRLAPWTLICRISGFERYPEERLGIYRGYLWEHCSALGLKPTRELSAAPELTATIDAMLGGCDSRETYWKLRRGALKEIDCLAPVSKAAPITELMCASLCDYPRDKLGIALYPQVQGRAFRIECSLLHFAGWGGAANDAAKKTSAAIMAAGAYFDRPYGHLADMVYGIDPDSTEALRRIKKIFDPDGILNPGRLCF